jgi:hypothetical protein
MDSFASKLVIVREVRQDMGAWTDFNQLMTETSAPIHRVISPLFPQEARNFLTSLVNISFSTRTLVTEYVNKLKELQEQSKYTNVHKHITSKLGVQCVHCY